MVLILIIFLILPLLNQKISKILYEKKHEKLNYQDIIELGNLKKGLAITKRNVAPGLWGEIKANFTEKNLEVLFKALKSQGF
jgi:hypothetical protein